MLLLCLSGCNFAVWYCVTASWPQVYADLYGWSSVAIGLAYLLSSVTIVIAGLDLTPWMNARYRQTSHEQGLPVNSHGVEELANRIGSDSWPMASLCRDACMCRSTGLGYSPACSPSSTLGDIAVCRFVAVITLLLV